MFRLLAIFLLGACFSQVTTAAQDSNALLEYLSNFPGLGNMVNSLRSLMPSPTQDVENPSPPEDEGTYSFTEWSVFGGCSKICGGGTRTRSRWCVNATGHQVTVNKCFKTLPFDTYDLYKLLRLRNQKKEFDEELCNKQECRVSPWTLEDSCSRKCGGGVMTFSRTCYDSQNQAQCNFQSTRLDGCNTKPCFKVGEWNQWSKCTAACGGGRSSRKRDCQPNVPPFSPLYQELMYALEHVQKPGVLKTIENDDEIYYFTQYLTSCGSNLVQTGLCNAHLCPACPMNQVYHTCKPCSKVCPRISISDISDMKFDMPKIYLNPNGCNGVCEAGCGCRMQEPLLGKDGGCYAFSLLCPENNVSPVHRQYLILQLLTRKRTTTPKPKPKTTPSLQRALPTTTTTTDLPTKKCPKEIPMVDFDDFCVCEGVFQRMQCITRPGKKCPIKCTDKPTCPALPEAREKSRVECTEQSECSSDSVCDQSPFHMCCELVCGRRCIDVTLNAVEELGSP